MAENSLSHPESALRTNEDQERVRATIVGLREHGTGANRQRRAFAARESLNDVLTDVIARTDP